MIDVRPFDGPLGAELEGVDLRAPLDGPQTEEVRQALYAHSLVVIRGQRLDAHQLDRFAQLFGTPRPHILDHLRLPEQPSVLLLSNVFESGEPIGVYDGAAYWHTDMSFERIPAAATVVHSLEAPRSGGETLFASMFRAYDALPATTRRRVSELVGLHHYGNRDDLEESSGTSASRLSERQQEKVENVFHPLVLRHPVTARPALYAVAGSSFGIVGMPDGEALALLGELKAHALAPQFVHAHHYQAGDVVVWDNFSTLHSATAIPPASGSDDRRLLYRISVVSDVYQPPVGPGAVTRRRRADH